MNLTKDYKNLQEKNNVLNNSLAEDHYNKYAKDIDGLYKSLDPSLQKTKPGKSIKENIAASKKKPAAPIAPTVNK